MTVAQNRTNQLIIDLATILVTAACGSSPPMDAMIHERASMINLSVDSTMLLSVLVGFAAALTTGSLLGFAAVALVGVAVAAVLELSLSLGQSQTAVGFHVFAPADTVPRYRSAARCPLVGRKHAIQWQPPH